MQHVCQSNQTLYDLLAMINTTVKLQLEDIFRVIRHIPLYSSRKTKTISG